jgi:BMFP domain-containing protein YqiC
MALSPVTRDQFDELVASSTKYLQTLMDRTTELEKRIEALEAKPKRSSKTDG